jgi:hypothetical protein
MRSAIVIAVCSALWSFALVRQAEACWQEAPSVSIRSRSVTGTVSRNGKPMEGAVLTLHKFLGSYSVEPGHGDPHRLGRAITGKDGSFNFGGVPPGRYVIFMASPSGEFTEVEVVRPRSSDENDRVSIDFFADGCQSATAISASGRAGAPPLAPTVIVVNRR